MNDNHFPQCFFQFFFLSVWIWLFFKSLKKSLAKTLVNYISMLLIWMCQSSMHNNHSIKSRGCPEVPSWKVWVWFLFCSVLLWGGGGWQLGPKVSVPNPTLHGLMGYQSRAPNLYRLRVVPCPYQCGQILWESKFNTWNSRKAQKVEHINLQEKTEKMASELVPRRSRPALSKVWYVNFPWNLWLTPDPLNKFLIGIY